MRPRWTTLASGWMRLPGTISPSSTSESSSYSEQTDLAIALTVSYVCGTVATDLAIALTVSYVCGTVATDLAIALTVSYVCGTEAKSWGSLT